MRICRWAKSLLVLALCTTMSGCYYMQAAAGQWQVLRKSEPIDDVIDEDDTPDELSGRLRLVQAARRFSIDELGLPDNESYRSYTDIEREFVVWNVFAAPEFSLQARQWCFPVAGCVSYRGYFSRDAAYREAEQLADKGYDVAVGGVSAYSTLGNFNDPVLSSMLRWDDIQLVGTLFHELAHQLLYVKGDSVLTSRSPQRLKNLDWSAGLWRTVGPTISIRTGSAENGTAILWRWWRLRAMIFACILRRRLTMLRNES